MNVGDSCDCSWDSIQIAWKIDELRKLYTFDNFEDIKNFLILQGLDFVNILIEAYKNIRIIFDPHISDICLEMYRDYEEDYQGLSVIIKTNLIPKLSLNLLDKFDEKWWLDIDIKFLSIMVRPI
jgi:hypothetical protein